MFAQEWIRDEYSNNTQKAKKNYRTSLRLGDFWCPGTYGFNLSESARGADSEYQLGLSKKAPRAELQVPQVQTFETNNSRLVNVTDNLIIDYEIWRWAL